MAWEGQGGTRLSGFGMCDQWRAFEQTRKAQTRLSGPVTLVYQASPWVRILVPTSLICLGLLTVLELGKAKIKVPTDSVSGEGTLLHR
jgi:hypothetical protein